MHCGLARPEEGAVVMGFLSRLLVCIGLSFGLTLLLMVAMYEPEDQPLTASQSVTSASAAGVSVPGLASGIR